MERDTPQRFLTSFFVETRPFFGAVLISNQPTDCVSLCFRILFSVDYLGPFSCTIILFTNNENFVVSNTYPLYLFQCEIIINADRSWDVVFHHEA